MRNLLGGKGANLAEMSNLGLPVPPGLTITTEVCTYYYANGEAYPAELKAAGRRRAARGRLFRQEQFRRSGGQSAAVSVRSGARASMPGMMDTVLNLGLNDATVEGAGQADRRRSVSPMTAIAASSDVFRRGAGPRPSSLRGNPRHLQGQQGLSLDTDLTPDWVELHRRYKARCAGEPASRVSARPACEQLWGAIGAVFGSWMNARAITYRTLHNIPESWGTAVNVQAMVFGNMGETSATGVAFTRNPSTGEKRSSTANSSSTRRARMWWRASARRRTFPKRRASSPAPTSRRWKR
jgi:pyruvate,orthophosphate dikinase